MAFRGLRWFLSAALCLTGCGGGGGGGDGGEVGEVCCEGNLAGTNVELRCGELVCIGDEGFRCAERDSAESFPSACDPGSCGGSTCSGCCDDGVCRPGSLAAACGSGGNTCVSCAAGEVCEDGTCVNDPTATCGPETCDGCCDGEACLSGTSSASCGADGRGCVECADDEICEAGACTCVPDCTGRECGDDGCGASCGSCDMRYTCDTGACVPDPEGLWDVYVVGATVASGAWDTVGPPDPFVNVRLGSVDDPPDGVSSTQKDTNNPSWEEVLTDTPQPAADYKEAMQFKIFDEDTSFHDEIGTCDIVVSDDMFGGGVQEVECGEATLRYEIVESAG